LDVYDAAARWLLFDWERRRAFTVPVMSCVRFGLLTPLQLTQIRGNSGEGAEIPEYVNIFSSGPVKKLLEDGLT
jgi:hypothetical protein